MPPLKVEYAKSGRSKCSACKNFILNGELRIGTGVMMPGMEEYSYKWRHICCFTSRQIKNAGSVDTVEGFDDLLDDHQPVVNKMLKGEYAGNLTWQGKFIHPEIKASEEAKAAKAAKKESGKVRQRKGKSAGQKKKNGCDDDDDSDDETDEYEDDSNLMMMMPKQPPNNAATAGVATSSTNKPAPGKKPMCPFGANCFKVTKEHYEQYAHPGDADLDPDVAAAINPIHQPLPPPPKQVLVKKHPPPAKIVVTSGRKPCQHGSDCFRKNPDHFKEFSHPGDADYNVAVSVATTTTTTAATTINNITKPQPKMQPPKQQNAQTVADGDCADPTDPTKCKYGSMCFRTDPGHFQKFKH